MFFAGGEKAIEGQRVFANVGVDEQRHFSVEFAECGVRGERNGDDVADTSDIDENLIRPFVSEPAAKLSDHRSPVLPLFFRPSTHGWGNGYSREKGTTRGRMRFAPEKLLWRDLHRVVSGVIRRRFLRGPQ